MKYLGTVLSKVGLRSKRSSVVAKNVVASFAIQGAALILALFILPAYIRFFDNELVLGVWFTMLSVLSWILNLDLGVGNGLRNRLVSALAESERTNAKKYVSSAYLLVFGLVSVLSVAVGLGFQFVDWNSLLGVPREAIDQGVLTQAVIITTVGILIQFLLRLVVSILYALQKSAVTGLLNLANSAVMLVVVLTMTSGTNSEKLLLLAEASVVAVNAPLIVASVIVFGTSLRGCLPRIRFFDRSYASDVAKVGGKFFALQIMYMLIANTDPFLISRLVGPQYVVKYQIYSRFFFLFSAIIILALQPVWSAVTQALSQGDLQWIDDLYVRIKQMALVALISLLALSWCLQWLLDVWLGSNSISVDTRYSLVFAALAGAMIWNGVLSSVVNGIGRLKVQLVAYSVGVLLKFPIAVLVTHYIGSWIGVIIASVIALLPYGIVQPVWVDRYLAELRVKS